MSSRVIFSYPLRCRREYSSIDPWPFDWTTRSRSSHSGSFGLNGVTREQAVAVSAAPSGFPGCPSPTRSIASIERKRMAFAMVRGSVMFMMLVPPSKAPHGALIGSSRSGWVWSAIAVGAQ